MKFRKKPVVIDAIQFTRGSLHECLAFLGDDLDSYDMDPVDTNCYIIVSTLEGVHRASLGDYLIRGVKGEHYPCKPDIFEMTYELVEDWR